MLKHFFILLLIIFSIQKNELLAAESKAELADAIEEVPDAAPIPSLFEKAQKIAHEVKDKLKKYLLEENIKEPMAIETIKGINSGNLEYVFGYLISEDHEGNNLEKLDIILKTQRININTKLYNSFTPIYLSIKLRKYEVFKFLLLNGAKLTEKNKKLLSDLLNNMSSLEPNEQYNLKKIYILLLDMGKI